MVRVMVRSEKSVRVLIFFARAISHLKNVLKRKKCMTSQKLSEPNCEHTKLRYFSAIAVLGSKSATIVGLSNF